MSRFSDARRRPFPALALIGAVLCFGSVLVLRPATAQTARSIKITPGDQLVDGQYIDVQFSGFKSKGDVRVRLCPGNATAVADCAADPQRPQDPGASRIARTDSSGNGSTPFVVRAQDIDRIGGGSKFQCDAQSTCKLLAFDLDGDGNELSFDASAAAPLLYALSTIACPQTDPRVAGSGAAAARADVVEWQAETCSPPLSLNVSYTTSNSVNGNQAFVNGLTDADFSMSAMPLTDADRQTMAARGVEPVHVPVMLGSLVLAYNLWIDKDGTKVQVQNLQLSPATVAGIIEGRITTWSDPAIKQDNIANYPDGFASKLILPVGRADNCAATWWLSSWLIAKAKDAWEAGGDSFKGGPTTIFPAGNGVDLRTGTDKVALDIREFPGQQGSNGVPEAGLIGFTYMSDALKLGLPVAALQNASGSFVKPTLESVTAAAAAATVTADGIFVPNFDATDPKAYPVPVVTYAVAPKAGPALDGPRREVLSKFLKYAVTDGQQKAELRGYVPLPASLQTKSDAAITQITQVATANTDAGAGAGSAPQAAAQTSTDTSTTPSAVATGSSGGGGAAPLTAAAATPAESGLAAPVAKVVSGVIKLLGGGSAPVTVEALLWLGAVLACCGRALSVLAARRRNTTSHTQDAPRLAEVNR